MVWRVKLVAELEPGLTTEVEVRRLERDEQAGLADLGLRLKHIRSLLLTGNLQPSKSDSAPGYVATCQ